MLIIFQEGAGYMKKIFAVVLIMVLVLAFAGCGSSSSTEVTDSGNGGAGATVSVEGVGYFAYNEGDALEADSEYNWTSLVINVSEPTNYSFGAQPEEGYDFVKWTLNGEDLSEDPEITVEITEGTELVAFFETAG